jgi:hypothetical protein
MALAEMESPCASLKGPYSIPRYRYWRMQNPPSADRRWWVQARCGSLAVYERLTVRVYGSAVGGLANVVPDDHSEVSRRRGVAVIAEKLERQVVRARTSGISSRASIFLAPQPTIPPATGALRTTPGSCGDDSDSEAVDG